MLLRGRSRTCAVTRSDEGRERMGLRDWLRRASGATSELLGRDGPPQAASADVSPVPDEVALTTSIQIGPYWGADDPVKMVGTTTEAADECRHMFAFKGLPDGGHFEAHATLVAMGAEGRGDPVVAVHVEGARIGFLPRYLAAQVNPGNGSLTGSVAQVQMWGARVGDGMRVVGWVAPGTGPIAWPHNAANPAAVTVEEERVEAHTSTTSMVRDALEGDDPIRAEQFQRGLVDGTHYLETIEPIRQLKREGRLDEALALCYQAIAGAEADRDGREPAPWYTQQAAIIHRKRGERDEEVAVLRRWVKACPPARRAGSRIQERLDKMTT